MSFNKVSSQDASAQVRSEASTQLGDGAFALDPQHQLMDNHGRVINYLRLAVTPNCNLRCRYCMPDGPLSTLLSGDLLSLEEMQRVVSIFASMGVNKLRLTGGEPLVWKHTPELLHYAYEEAGIDSVHVTTNGVRLSELLPVLMHKKLRGVNISLDTLKPRRFAEITQRDHFKDVWNGLEAAVASNLKVKINVVVQQDVNDDEILDFTLLAKNHPLDVRFIEEMTFNGTGGHKQRTTKQNIIGQIEAAYPDVQFSDSRENTALLVSPSGFRGRIGVIDGFGRSFCSACNRVRVTALGEIKTCLYKRGELSLKRMFREGASNQEIRAAIEQLFQGRTIDGHVSELSNLGDSTTSMSLIGG